jgi:hypothetical protein
VLSKYKYAMAKFGQFLELRRKDRQDHASGGKLAKDLIKHTTRRDIDASGRIIEQKRDRITREKPREQNLLLIAAGQHRDRGVLVVYSDGEALAKKFKPPPPRPQIDQSRSDVAEERRNREIVENRQIRKDTGRSTIARQISEALASAGMETANRTCTAPDLEFYRPASEGFESSRGFEKSLLSMPIQSGKADNFASAQTFVKGALARL